MKAVGATVADALRGAISSLRDAGVADAAGDARRLVAHALRISPTRLTLAHSDPLDPDAAARLELAVRARAARCPVAQITGLRAFWGREFLVTGAVLDPRPETETVIVQALSTPFRRVLDLGTGSGAILLSLLAERPDATGLGVDISPGALDVARRNAAALGMAARAAFRMSDWFEAVTGRFDLLTANPPYVTASEWAALAPEVRDWEPRGALVPDGDSGDGLAAYRHILAGAGRHLSPGGRLVVETGATQAACVAELAQRAGLAEVCVVHDLNGHARVVTGTAAQQA